MKDTAAVRRGAAAAALILPLAVFCGSWWLWRDLLPARVATHWSDLGTADDSARTGTVLTVVLVVLLVCAVAGTVAAALPRLGAGVRRSVLAAAGFGSGLALAGWLVPTWLTIRAGSASAAELGPWLLLLVGAPAYAVVPYQLAPPVVHAPDRTGSSTTVPPAGLPRSWSTTLTPELVRRLTMGMLVPVAAVAAAMAVSGRQGALLPILLVLLAAVAVMAVFLRVHVVVDDRGLRVSSGLGGLPIKRIRPEQIQAAETTELVPVRWGGWGYRFLPGRSALILHTGPGLVVTTTAGKQFAISLDEPEIPAALLELLRLSVDPD